MALPNLKYVQTRFLDLWAKKDINSMDHELFDQVIRFAQLVEDQVNDPDLTDYARMENIRDQFERGTHGQYVKRFSL